MSHERDQPKTASIDLNTHGVPRKGVIMGGAGTNNKIPRLAIQEPVDLGKAHP